MEQDEEEENSFCKRVVTMHW